MRGGFGRLSSILGNFTGQYVESLNSGLANGSTRHRVRFAVNESVISATMFGLTALTGWSFYKWAYLPFAAIFTGSPLLEKAQRALASAQGLASRAQGYQPSQMERGAIEDLIGSQGGFSDFFPYTGYVRSASEYSAAAQGINPLEQAARYTVTGDRGSRIDIERMIEEYYLRREGHIPQGALSPNGGLMPGQGDASFPQGYNFPRNSPPGSGAQQ